MRIPLPRSPLAYALLASLSLHAAEVWFAATTNNAILAALPPGARVRVLLLTLAAALLPALLGGLFALPLARRPALARAIAVVITILFPLVETLRHGDAMRGGIPIGFVIFGVGLATVLAFTAARISDTPHHRPPLRAPTAISVCVTLAVAIAGLSAFGLPDTQDVAIANDDRASLAESGATPPPTENLLVILVDTLRADHLGCYGYERDTTPRVDAFAAESARFQNAATPKPKTSPAIASLFTGLWPETHGIHSTSMVLPDEHQTLAEILRDDGFQTFAVAANVNISKRFGFDQGFDDFRRVRRSKGAGSQSGKGRGKGKGAPQVRDELFDWLEHRDEGRFFAYVHFIDPHCPYSPPKEWKARFRGDSLDGQLGVAKVKVGVKDYDEVIHEAVYLSSVGTDLDGYVARYDAEIAYTDHVVGEILDELDRRGLRETTTVVFTADHGESMTEHQTWFNHGEHPYEEQVHIPLIIRGPAVAPGVRVDQVSLVGLMPTLLDLVGVKPPDHVEAPSFSNRLTSSGPPGASDPNPDSVGTPTYLTARHGRKNGVHGIRTNRWKYLTRESGIDLRAAIQPDNILLPGRRIPTLLAKWRNQDLTVELYDLQQDPDELTNLAWKRPKDHARFRALMLAHARRERPDVPKPMRLKARDLPHEAAEELRQLGYLGGE